MGRAAHRGSGRAVGTATGFRLRRLTVALLISTAIFGAVYGLAASLGVSTKTLGAGTSSVAACQSGTLTSSYATAYSSTTGGYDVGVVTVSGLQSGCFGMSYRIDLTGTSSSSLAELTGTTPSSGTTFTADFTASNILAANVTGIAVVISG